MWNLGEPQLLRMKMLCGTWGTLYFLVWNLDMEPWGACTFMGTIREWDALWAPCLPRFKRFSRKSIIIIKGSLEETSELRTVGKRCD